MVSVAGKEIYAMIKKPTITETIRLNRLCWFGHVQRMEENWMPIRVLYMNLETTRLRGRPRNRWQDEVREDERLVVEKGWKEKVYNREEWKKLLRTARNRHFLQMPMEWTNECQLLILCSIDDGWMDAHEALVEWCWQEKTEVQRENLPLWKFDHHTSHMDWPQN